MSPSFSQGRRCSWHGTNTTSPTCATWSAMTPPTCFRSTSRSRTAATWGWSWWAAVSSAPCYAAPLMVECRATAPWVGRRLRGSDDSKLLNYWTLSHKFYITALHGCCTGNSSNVCFIVVAFKCPGCLDLSSAESLILKFCFYWGGWIGALFLEN